MKVEMWNTFYVRIEEIQGIYYKTDTIDQIKYDLPSCTDAPDLSFNYDESRMIESSAEDGSMDNYIDSMFVIILVFQI